MTLGQALAIAQRTAPAGKKRKVFLACGFEPLHLRTFFQAHFNSRFADEEVALETGLYGSLTEALSTAMGLDCEAVAVILEWSDFDPRLGLRSTGGWSLPVQPDILTSCREQFKRVLGKLETISALAPVSLVLPTLPIALFAHTAGWQSSSNELDLLSQLATFAAHAGKLAGVSIVSAARLDKISPVSSRLDPMMELKAGFPYSLGHAAGIAELLVASLYPPTPLKALITDLDDTLWAGIVGEVGSDGVSWSQSEHSQIHGLYQQFLKHLSDMGVLLAVVSKNELALVEETLCRADLFIPGTSFYPVKADWGPKSRHIADILRIWNIGPDSIIFVDDSPMELEEVRTAYPSMTCLQFSKKQPAAMMAMFETLRDLFGRPSVQYEDTLRKTTIQKNELFWESAEKFPDNGFVRSLGGKVTFEVGSSAGNQRLLQLVNKTNQFNLNGVRLSEGEWLQHIAAPSTFVVSVAYEDKFGPLGTIGVVAGKRTLTGLEISTWVMSCRAFSRRIEYHTLEFLFSMGSLNALLLRHERTDRNQPLQEFLERIGPGAAANNGWSISQSQFTAGNHELPHSIVVTGTASVAR